jgi:hypothetical protein
MARSQKLTEPVVFGSSLLKNKSQQRRKNMKSPKLQVDVAEISVSNIRDQIGALLYATGKVSDDKDIVEMDLGAIIQSLSGKAEVVPVHYKTKKRMEVSLIKNG